MEACSLYYATIYVREEISIIRGMLQRDNNLNLITSYPYILGYKECDKEAASYNYGKRSTDIMKLFRLMTINLSNRDRSCK